ncbi:histidinol-phosphatase [Chitinophaga caeni]|uniref:Histidinol-phosphatase n=1 Tax=Chitinophaga caeni TaxID=2029983 RepID=A0A291QVG5_9BACT|nr:DNA polymerase/3'-5' exonuclease PolX [Chitinophaga caeni]ATL47925.1 histidinol-phosphatase [Chitinophaga caeni]
MDNHVIADQFTLLAKLMDVHGENSFKAKSYANAAFQIDKLTVPLSETPRDAIFKIKGIGDSTGKSIIEMLDTGRFKMLEDYIDKTPAGVLDMMKIKGLGPKKIATIWKELEIESLGELLYACNENRLLLLKGFGEKTQASTKQSIEFFLSNRERHLYAEIEPLAMDLLNKFEETFSPKSVSLTGAYRRQQPVIDEIEFVIAVPVQTIKDQWVQTGIFTELETTPQYLLLQHEQQVKVKIYTTNEEDFANTLFVTSATEAFLDAFYGIDGGESALSNVSSETEIFEKARLPYIEPCLRETADQLNRIASKGAPKLIHTSDIKGIIHSHSQWSDGLNSLQNMAEAARAEGFEYLVISDHSKSAFYANGLQPERITAQHQEIEALNQQLAPFKIFKSIEADILNDGSLDYPDEILASFDLAIASVHTNLKMSETKAMERLLKAIQNPYTTILGHLTGRLLLSRNGYPLDHSAIIDACIENNVIIELNAHPRRLDIDWSYLAEAVEKGAMISIDPDAHSIEGYKDIRYGVLAAQKGGLPASQNFSSFNREAIESYIQERKQKKGII